MTYEPVFVFSCWKEAFAAHFRDNSAPSHGEHYTGYCYPKCNYLLYSISVITMGRRRNRESSSEPKSSVPQLRDVSSVASLVPLWGGKITSRPGHWFLMLESPPVTRHGQVHWPGSHFPARVSQAALQECCSRYTNTLATPLTAFSLLLEYLLAFQKVIPRPFNEEVNSSAKQFLLEYLRSESCSTHVYLVNQASRKISY